MKIVSMALLDDAVDATKTIPIATFDAEFGGLRFSNCVLTRAVDGHLNANLPSTRTRAGVPAGVKIIDAALLREFRERARGAYRALTGATEIVAAG